MDRGWFRSFLRGFAVVVLFFAIRVAGVVGQLFFNWYPGFKGNALTVRSSGHPQASLRFPRCARLPLTSTLGLVAIRDLVLSVLLNFRVVVLIGLGFNLRQFCFVLPANPFRCVTVVFSVSGFVAGQGGSKSERYLWSGFSNFSLCPWFLVFVGWLAVSVILFFQVVRVLKGSP